MALYLFIFTVATLVGAITTAAENVAAHNGAQEKEEGAEQRLEDMSFHLQPVRVHASAVHASAAEEYPTSDIGYVDYAPPPGMSGGAVVDMHCGLLGIIQGAEGDGGTFVRFTPSVIQRIMAAVEDLAASE
jgi:hypothetical protein